MVINDNPNDNPKLLVNPRKVDGLHSTETPL